MLALVDREVFGNAVHERRVIVVPPALEFTECDVVGPICESGDFLAKGRKLPPVARGDVLAVFTAGAYGMAMASNYNSRGRAAEVMVEGDAAWLIRERETPAELFRGERLLP